MVAALQTNNPVAANRHSNTITSVPAVERFSFNKADWTPWIAHYEKYRIVSGLDKEQQKLQITNLLLSMGLEVDKFLEILNKAEEDFKT